MQGYTNSIPPLSLTPIDIKSSSQHTLYLTLLEITVMLTLAFFQVYSIKKVLENKRVI
jgi:hypothetical protein